MKRNATTHAKGGFGIIEVIVSIGIAAVVIAVTGNVFASIQKINSRSVYKDKAISYAKEYLEIITAIQTNGFSCSCASDACAGNICTRTSDGQTCVMKQGYQSCWTALPKNLATNSPLFLDRSTGAWALHQGTETISGTPLFTRSLTIENQLRDASGNIAQAGNVDTNTKKITVTVSWNENGHSSSATLATIVTSWKEAAP